MELRLPPEALAPATVTCSGCGQTIYEDEAQAARWGYWSDGVGDLYAYCIECPTREFAPDAPASGLVPLVHGRAARSSDS
jgi:hypothetical protein